MREQLGFILRHGYWVLFTLNLGGQLGLPIPSGTALLAAGALAAAGALSGPRVVGLAILAALLGHGAWFFAGRLGGSAVLRFVCKVSLEPDSCVRRTNDLFARHGAKSLLVAPFIPGFATVAPPLAGTSGMSLLRFLLLDGLGAAIWAASLVGLGYFLGPTLETLLGNVAALWPLLGAVLILFAAWIGLKLEQRRRLLTALDVPRMTPEALQDLRRRGAPHAVVDLRHAHELALEPFLIPGALHITAGDLAGRAHELPRHLPIVLYCN